MRWNGFGSSLAFAVAAAALAPALWHLTGHAAGLELVWIAVAAIYAFGLAPGAGAARRTSALGAAAAVAGTGLAASALGLGPAAVAAALTVALAGARSFWIAGPGGERRIGLEVAIGVGSLGLGAWLIRSIGDGALALAAGLWGYFLVQSVYWLVAGASRGSGGRDGDGFEQARRRLEALLEESP